MPCLEAGEQPPPSRHQGDRDPRGGSGTGGSSVLSQVSVVLASQGLPSLLCLCMLPSGTTAFLQLLTPTGEDAQGTAISGTVTVVSVSAAGITGTSRCSWGGRTGTRMRRRRRRCRGRSMRRRVREGAEGRHPPRQRASAVMGSRRPSSRSFSRGAASSPELRCSSPSRRPSRSAPADPSVPRGRSS